MVRNKKVLIALDFHPSAKQIIEAGYSLAKEMKANVVLLHVKIDLVGYSLTYKKMGSLRVDNIEDLELAAHDFLEKSKKYLGDDMIQTIVKQGSFASSILNTAKEMAVDIIVMGSHSTKWLEEIVMGRVTNEVLQQTNIPLLIIPTRKSNRVNTLISLDDQTNDITNI
jgi:nucleotide-binding universal stress UspA family protein